MKCTCMHTILPASAYQLEYSNTLLLYIPFRFRCAMPFAEISVAAAAVVVVVVIVCMYSLTYSRYSFGSDFALQQFPFFSSSFVLHVLL